VRGRLARLDAEDNLVFCEDREETVMLIGVKGLVVVRAGDRTLIVPRERAEEVKKLAEKTES
jgi:mannose-1-phosphate guanylyltransferase